MRWVASIQIVLYHMYPHAEGFKRYAGWCATWTQLFFLLSGFVLAYAELSKPPKTGNARPSILRYIRRRLTVIYPAFFLSLLLKVTYAPGRSAFEWAMLPLHGLLLQSWFPICHATQSGHATCSPWLFNGEAWFLSVLLVFWFTLRPLAELFRRRSLCFSAFSLLACWLFSLVFHVLGSQNRLAGWLGCTDSFCPMVIMVAIRSTPLGYFHVFVAGVAAARIFLLTAMRDAETGGRVSADTRRIVLAAERAPLLLRFGCCCGYLCYAALLFLATSWIGSYYYFFHNGGMMPVMVLILLGAAIGTDPVTTWVFRSKPMLVLGRISYMQYLMQHVLQGWIRRAFGWQDNAVAQAIFVPCLILFSYCCQRWVERPYTEYQRFRQDKGIKGFEDRGIDWFDRKMRKAQADA
uniref:Acyltransferase 3 domain-containing protein n=1 Tax=Zooxanthella nutricula TaxID=1333877 RepID=A0A7S2LS83_9DINO|mmetsp:Transcript_65179/g.199350  ORF Transcript_65179/g.199350 Transcript_65179/m.199350 type:complete len:407 (+) Transcript_65179:2-1222(+)